LNNTSGFQKTYSVDVGASGDLVFNPNQVDATVGDIIEFNFLALNHTLMQSELSDPCSPNGQFDTGFN
jgi:plastocyanin